VCACILSAPLHHAEDEIVRLKASEEALDKLMDDYHEHIEKVRLLPRGRPFQGVVAWSGGMPCVRACGVPVERTALRLGAVLTFV
jgi:hypothetical protein